MPVPAARRVPAGLGGDHPTGVTEGSGTKEDPYQISTSVQLQQLAAKVNEGTDYKDTYFEIPKGLGTIDLTIAGDIQLPGSIMLPIIGNQSSRMFAGHFDGNGNTITNLNTTSATYACAGLFGYLAEGGEVKNLTVEGTVAVSGRANVGGVVGQLITNQFGTAGTVTNCYYDSDDTPNSNSVTGAVGKDSDAFTSGEVAWLLKGATASEQIWGQKLGTEGDESPQLRIGNDPTKYAPVVYKVTLHYNYDEKPVEDMYVNDLSQIKAERTGFILGGWYTDQGFADGTKVETVDRDLELYAKWDENSTVATVTFLLNDGTGTEHRKVEVTRGDPVDRPADPTRTGYTFGGWYKEAACTTAYDFTTPVTENLTLYAKWETVKHTVTFNWNYDGAKEPFYEDKVDYNTAVTKPADPIRADGPNGAKYTFAGWYTDEDCTIEYNFTTPVTENLTLYAKWETVTYTVTFNWNCDGAAEPFDTVTVDSGTAVAEPDPKPFRDGFAFGGWYTNAACTTAYNFGEPVKNDLTLYAKWTGVQEKKGLISYYDPKNQSASNEKEALILTDDSATASWKADSATDGWYAVRGNVTIPGVTVSSNVNLILENGCNLTVTGGINIPSGSSLTIWGQNKDYTKDGALTAQGTDSTTGHGGDAIGSIGALTINGGVITATGGSSSAQGGALPDREGIVDNVNDVIFGGAGICAGPLTIKGGIINATGGNGYGYGGFGITSKGDAPIEISGGEVTAKGGDTTGVRTGFKYWYGGHGLAFFDSKYNINKAIIISGSKVTATGGTAVIEPGSAFLTTAYYGEGGTGLGNCGAITITDSEVTVQGGNGTAWGGNGLGAYQVGTKGNITISNSTVRVKGGEQTLAYDSVYYYGGSGIDCINLAIDGGSEVTATGGDGRDGDSYGIRLYDSGSQYFTITDSTVTATAGAGSSAYSTADGIWLYTGEFTVNSGTVTVNGGRYGINALATTIKGGTVTAVGTVAAFSRKPDIASSYTHITTDPSEETAYEWTGASDETIWTEAALKIRPWTVQAPGFTVTASPATVAPGGTSALKAVLTFDLGSGKTPVKDVTADTAFTLTPEDGYDEQTKIDGATLTVGEGEEAESLTVTATYPKGSGEYDGTATVTVGITDEEEPAFSLVSLKVNSTGITLKAGGTMSQPAALAATVASSVTQFTITVQYEGSGVVKYGIAKDVLAETGAVLENGKPSEAIKINGNKTAIYLYAASTDAPDSGVYYELTVTKQSGGGSTGGGGSTTTTTTTTTNPDGSITTTTTDKSTGTVTQTTKNTDGTTSTVETKTDGTVTTTEKAANGVEVKTVDQPGRSVTAAVTVPDGVKSVTVTIPDAGVTPGTTAIDAATGELIMLSVPVENGLAVNLDGSRNIILVDNSKEFADVGAGHWAENSVAFVSSHRLFVGTSDTTFSPEENTSRIQLMTVLARLDGAGTGGLTLQEGMKWAVSVGISDGTNPDAAISRQQVAVMLWRYAGSPESSQALTAADAGDAADYARTALAWAVEVGILAGYPDGTLKPEGNASRAQLAAMVQRFCATMV